MMRDFSYRLSLTLLTLGFLGVGLWPAAAQETTPRAVEVPEPIVVPAPPKEAFSSSASRAKPRTRLTVTARKPSGNKSDERWLQENGLTLPAVDYAFPGNDPLPTVPREVPGTLRGLQLNRLIRDGKDYLALYGADGAGSRYVAVIPRGGPVKAVLDFEAFLMPPDYLPAEKQFVVGGIQWADLQGSTLYVSSGHNTYARSSKGLNAWVTAVDLGSGKIRWRSNPLVCNSDNFLLMGDVLVCGYGFTDEKDFLYVLNRHDGKVLQTVPLATGPDWILRKDKQLFVRCYGQDYLLRIR